MKAVSDMSLTVIINLVEWIEKNLNYNLSVNTIVDKSGFSRRHLHNLFRKHTHMNLSEYIRVRRLTKAAILIKFTLGKIDRISSALCYSSLQNFSRSFRFHFKCSPLQYRKENTLDCSKLLSRKLFFTPELNYYELLNKKFNLGHNIFNHKDSLLNEIGWRKKMLRYKMFGKQLRKQEVIFVLSEIEPYDEIGGDVRVNARIGEGGKSSGHCVHFKKCIMITYTGFWNDYYLFVRDLYNRLECTIYPFCVVEEISCEDIVTEKISVNIYIEKE
ncbi:helix-turn-helix transcriptional regulator [Salmonella enterica]|nr:helix-turn-helix transcriptional regulator [Salmonella enterica subsp. diarizonae]ELG3412741.1 helix-turn-helix transcriptional regulator [Salmonella enterica]